MFINYYNYKGGINNLIVVSDNKGICGRSIKDKETAIKNYLKNLKKYSK